MTDQQLELKPEKGEHSEQAGIQSVETGMKLLFRLAELCLQGPPPKLKTLAAEADMPPAKAHRYLVSFVRTGIVERDPATGRYRLGAMARHIGASALRSLDIVRIASARLPQICADLNQSVALSVWAYYGPTIVSVEDVRRSVSVGTRIGEVMPILRSATGRVYGAWLSPGQTAALIENELKENRSKKSPQAVTTKADADRILQQTKEDGVGYVEGGLNPVINAVAAPVFDFAGHLAGAIAVLGERDSLDPRPGQPMAIAIRNAADAVSRELGYTTGAPRLDTINDRKGAANLRNASKHA